MAEIFSRDRLQPALFDRLIDDEPANQIEAIEKRAISKQRLRQSVLRDLTWLLNAQGDLWAEPGLTPERAGAALHSVLNFGLPAMSGKLVSKLEIHDLERLLHDVIARFEPRILSNTLAIRALPNEDPLAHHNTLSFEIVGQLWAQPYPIELLLKTDLDLETGLIEVRDDAPTQPAAAAAAPASLA